MTRVAVVDDHVLLAEMLARELTARGNEVTVIDVECDVVTEVEEASPDVVVLDLEFGTDRTAGVRLLAPLVAAGRAVIVLTGVTDELVLGESLEMGASGLLFKSEHFDTLVDAISDCCDGRPVPPCDSERWRLVSAYAVAHRMELRRLEPFGHLTGREREVLDELMHGRSATEISESSFVSVSTVRSQIKSVLRKLGVSSQLQAVALASDCGWDRDREESGEGRAIRRGANVL